MGFHRVNNKSRHFALLFTELKTYNFQSMFKKNKLNICNIKKMSCLGGGLHFLSVHVSSGDF